jgi:toxin CptA
VAQLQCEVRLSWRTQLISLLVHGALMLLILLSPWPVGYAPVWVVLLTLVVFECIRSQKRIAARQGELRWLGERRIEWRGREWMIVKQPWMPSWGILLTLQQINGKKRRRLWLASDALSTEEWCHLQRLLRYPQSGDDEE